MRSCFPFSVDGSQPPAAAVWSTRDKANRLLLLPQAPPPSTTTPSFLRATAGRALFSGMGDREATPFPGTPVLGKKASRGIFPPSFPLFSLYNAQPRFSARPPLRVGVYREKIAFSCIALRRRSRRYLQLHFLSPFLPPATGDLLWRCSEVVFPFLGYLSFPTT